MKKNIISILALVVALAALLLAVSAYLSCRNLAEIYDARLAQLEDTVAQLTANQEVLPESQNRYCNLVTGDWSHDRDTLTLDTAYAQVLAEGTGLDSACLILLVNGQAYSTLIIEMAPGEAESSYELDLSGTVLPLPDLKTGDHLELRLEASLTDGSEVSAQGGTWDWENGQLLMVAG